MGFDAIQRDVLQAMGHTLYGVRGIEDPLHLALLHAAGRDAGSSDATRLCAGWPASGLRGDAAAKRALWPALRALRPR